MRNKHPETRNPGIGAAYGSLHGRAKLNESQVLHARHLARSATFHSKKQRFVVTHAKRWGVAPATLWRAITGETWKHLPGAIDRS